VRALGLSESRLFPLDVRALKLRVVPTVLIVDQHGVILAVSEGGGDHLDELASWVLAEVAVPK
jgi:hypothetical protein